MTPLAGREGMGTSPRARGPRADGPGHAHARGNIPACAGTTSGRSRSRTRPGEHPRVRGDHTAEWFPTWLFSGTSPRARGPQSMTWPFTQASHRFSSLPGNRTFRRPSPNPRPKPYPRHPYPPTSVEPLSAPPHIHAEPPPQPDNPRQPRPLRRVIAEGGVSSTRSLVARREHPRQQRRSSGPVEPGALRSDTRRPTLTRRGKLRANRRATQRPNPPKNRGQYSSCSS